MGLRIALTNIVAIDFCICLIFVSISLFFLKKKKTHYNTFQRLL
ncbi:hypothetical protein F383_24026 [Gossypium arboreum]|uniref:Uncharacterized protein n=1 Tax=Gossypium arboreum TaxID=29729 RepID=A0A0B0P402_GOSAR|nr:hypothetical protein F383_24026 [Gossypium arboreum]